MLPHSLSGPRQRVLVTGGSGFIGSHLVDRLLARGDHVIAVDNFDPFYSPEEKRRNLSGALQNPAFRLVVADCADPAQLRETLDAEPIDTIVHLAAKAGVRPSLQDPLGYARANIIATQALLELARQWGVRRFIFGSSSSVYGNRADIPFSEDDRADRPVSPYAATKRAGEVLCHTYAHLYGMRIIALRFFTVYGPRQRPDLAVRKFATLMLRGEPVPIYGDGSAERDYTWIDDIVDGILAAIDWTVAPDPAFEIVNLGESRTTSVRRLLELLGDALQVEPRIVHHPPQPGDVLRTCADLSKAERLLGYRPKVPVEVGIPRFAEWIRTLQPA